MVRQPETRWLAKILARLRDGGGRYPDLGHGAFRIETSEWPLAWDHPHALDVRCDNGGGLYARRSRTPIAFRPHWLMVKGQLYRGHFLDWSGSYALLHNAESGASEIDLLLGELAGSWDAPQLSPPQVKVPDVVGHVDPLLSWVYEVVNPHPKRKDEYVILGLPGSVFDAVACALETIAPPVTATPLPPTVPGESPDTDLRPAVPNQQYCLVRPNIIRWNGQITVQQRLWNLLHAILAHGKKQIAFDDLDVAAYGKEVPPRRLQNDLSELGQELLRVTWPCTYTSKNAYVLVDGPVVSPSTAPPGNPLQ